MATSTYLFFTLIIASSLCSFGVSRVEPQKVTLSVYHETQCPYCATFIVKNLARIFDNGLITILNLRLHGPDVCKLNSLEACALDVLQDVNKHFALIYCIEFLVMREGTRRGKLVSAHWDCL
ncbi:hypothetical protein ACFX1T_033003 [Malus domestica]